YHPTPLYRIFSLNTRKRPPKGDLFRQAEARRAPRLCVFLLFTCRTAPAASGSPPSWSTAPSINAVPSLTEAPVFASARQCFLASAAVPLQFDAYFCGHRCTSPTISGLLRATRACRHSDTAPSPGPPPSPVFPCALYACVRASYHRIRAYSARAPFAAPPARVHLRNCHTPAALDL